MLLNTKVFSEKNAPSTLDAKWLKFIPLIALVILIVMVALKYRECSGIATMFLCCRSYIVGMRTTVSTTKNWRNVSVSVAMWWWWECVTRSLFIWRSFASLRLCSCEGRRRSGNRRAWWRRESCLRRVLSTRRGTNLFSHRHRRNGSRSWQNGGLYGTGEVEGEEGTLKYQSPLRLIIVIHQQVSFQIVGVAPKRSGSTMIVTNRSFDWSGVLAIARWWGIIWIIGWHLIY